MKTYLILLLFSLVFTVTPRAAEDAVIAAVRAADEQLALSHVHLPAA